MFGLGRLFSASPTGNIISAIGNAVDAIFTSDEEKAQAAYLMAKLKQQPYILQAEINKVEARHKSLFVAGWRPFIGWVCGLGLCFTFLIVPGLEYMGYPAPNIPTDIMYNMVLALLGLGGFRTFEKLRGVSSNDMKKPQDFIRPIDDIDYDRAMKAWHKATIQKLADQKELKKK